MNLRNRVFVLFLGQLVYSACCASSTESTVVINTHKDIRDFNVGQLGHEFNDNKTKLIKIEKNGTLLFKNYSNLQQQELTPSINNYGTLLFTTPELTRSQKYETQLRSLSDGTGLYTIYIANPYPNQHQVINNYNTVKITDYSDFVFLEGYHTQNIYNNFKKTVVEKNAMFKIGKKKHTFTSQLKVQYINKKGAETIIDGSDKQEGHKAHIFIEGKNKTDEAYKNDGKTNVLSGAMYVNNATYLDSGTTFVDENSSLNLDQAQYILQRTAQLTLNGTLSISNGSVISVKDNAIFDLSKLKKTNLFYNCVTTKYTQMTTEIKFEDHSRIKIPHKEFGGEKQGNTYKFIPNIQGNITIEMPQSLFDAAGLAVQEANNSIDNKFKLFEAILKETKIEFTGTTEKAQFAQYETENNECDETYDEC
ncbi:MAG: hypothetical protein IJ481_03120 [Alphaproteobacteria bacterium]|nr:hypothetical protein [Alphaproteobacteria bacterium]